MVSNLETGEPRFGAERKKDALDNFFKEELSRRQAAANRSSMRGYVGAIPAGLEQWAPQGRIVYDKFHIMPHANKAIDEMRRAEFFPQRRAGEAKAVAAA